MLNRRRLLASAAALAALPAAATAQGAGAAAQASALYDQLFQTLLQLSPVAAAELGLDKGELAGLKRRLDDRSAKGRLGVFQLLVDARPKLKAIDRKALSGADAVRYDTLVWLSDRQAETASFAYGGVDSYGYPVPYVVTQLTGAYQAVPEFLNSKHAVENRADAEAYLARLEAFGQNLRDENLRLKADAGRGVVAPDFILDKTLAQLKLLAAETGPTAGLAASLGKRAAAKGLGDDWAARAAAIVDGPIAKALAEQIAILTAQRAGAKHDAGIGSRPDGQRYYAHALRYHTTTDLTPEQAHQVGLQQVADLTAQLDGLLKAQGLSEGPVGSRLQAFGKDPAQLYPNTDEGRGALLAELNRQMADIAARAPQVFDKIPKARMEIRRVPPTIEMGAPRGYAEGGSLDGSRPGAFYINLRDTADWPKWTLPTLTYHEAVPGHLFHGALVQEHGDTPMLFKTLGFTAYGEGWGLYAEQVAGELGVYDAYPAGRIGFLQSFLYRAARIVLDTGLHAKGWSREQAIAYMIDTVGLPRGAVENEVDRFVVWPGQACGYKIGHTEIDRLRTKARTALGPKFDIKGFHDTVLLGGSLPLAVLETVVDGWVAQQKTA